MDCNLHGRDNLGKEEKRKPFSKELIRPRFALLGFKLDLILVRCVEDLEDDQDSCTL